jgi:16S rRNA (cytosine1402-N4)-methyltransferase
MIHIPVLKEEVLEALAPQPNENFVDCTCGAGGHTAAILKKNLPKGKVLGIEADAELCQKLKERIGEFSNRLIVENDSYKNLKEIVKRYDFGPVNGILLDLGMSSWHIDEAGRGFSFRKDEPLNMSYQGRDCLTAEEVINNYSEEGIERILEEYGEERFSRKIVREIIGERRIRPLKTTLQLVEVIKRAIPSRYHYGKIHFATRTFQAIRIEVNRELDNLKKALPSATEVLESGGRLAIISFHSLEDRIVKNFLKENKNYFKVVSEKPVEASGQEIKINPRSRSAKLRFAIKR